MNVVVATNHHSTTPIQAERLFCTFGLSSPVGVLVSLAVHACTGACLCYGNASPLQAEAGLSDVHSIQPTMLFGHLPLWWEVVRAMQLRLHSLSNGLVRGICSYAYNLKSKPLRENTLANAAERVS